MIRAVIAFVVLVLVLGIGGLYAAYGEIEPCRMLAVESARRMAPDAAAEPAQERLTRAATSQMTPGACLSKLLDSWGGRMAAARN